MSEQFQATFQGVFNKRKPQATESQKKMLDGKKHYFVRALLIDKEYLYIYGIQESLEAIDFSIEQKMAELLKTDPDYEFAVSEWEYEKQRYREMLAQELLYGKCYSVVVPEGEYGSTNVYRVAEISEDDFNEAKSLDWPLVEGAYLALIRERKLQNDEV